MAPKVSFLERLHGVQKLLHEMNWTVPFAGMPEMCVKLMHNQKINTNS